MPSLSDAAIRNAAPQAKPITLWDDSLKGFGCRIHPTGRRTWVVLIASGRRQAIGHYPLVSLADARREARRLLAEKELGKVRPHRVSFQAARADFLKDCTTRIKPRTVYDYTRILGRFEFPALADITARAIIRALEPLSGHPAERHHCFTVLKVFFTWCVKHDLLDLNPMLKLLVPKKPTSRERVLSEDELRRLWTRLSSAPEAPSRDFDTIVRLLILTGQRRGEIAALQWSWINEADRTITLPSSITKNKRAHTFPYGDLVESLFRHIPTMVDCPYVFPAARRRNDKTTVFNGWSKPKVALDKRLDIAPFTLHDIRRSYASGMQQLGVRIEVTERLLNHVSGTQAGIVSVYPRYHWLPEMREAVDRWERYLAELVTSITEPA